MKEGRKYVERNLKKIRTKLWDTMYSERQYIPELEYELLDQACLLITDAIASLNQLTTKGEEE